jgi:uncharacterized protein YkwD
MRYAAALSLAVVSALLVPAAAAAAPAKHDGIERAIVRAVNEQRAAHDLAPVKPHRSLARAADFHTREMLSADYFAHTSRDGGAFAERVRRFVDFRSIGETLAWVTGCGRGGARTVVDMWMSSSGHRAILLAAKYRRIGIGKRRGSLGSQRACVVTADFASHR